MDKAMIILFDLDGTLIDSTQAIVESFFYACDSYDFKRPSKEKIQSLIGYPLDIMFRSIGVSEEDIETFVSRYKQHYRKIHIEKTTLLPYAKEAIVDASQIASLGIVTTKTGKYSRELMEHFGMMKYFDVLIGREHVTHPKPNKEPILKALSFFDNDSDVVFIGDTPLDLQSAQSAKVEAIGLLCGYGSKSELEKYNFILKLNAFEAIKYLRKEKK